VSSHQPPVFIFGIQVNEPVTTVTALMISAVCLYAFIKLSKIPSAGRVHFFLRFYFLAMAIATANGGIIGHAFLFHFSFAWKLIGWITSMMAIMLVERASIEYTSHFIKPSLAKLLRWINIIELATFITLTIHFLKFFFVEIHTTYGLLIVVSSLHFFVYSKIKSRGSLLFLIAVGFSAISALIYMNEWDVSKWFNHSDLSHIFLVITAWFFYLGAVQIANDSINGKIQRT
jgi:hypothetical protein